VNETWISCLECEIKVPSLQSLKVHQNYGNISKKTSKQHAALTSLDKHTRICQSVPFPATKGAVVNSVVLDEPRKTVYKKVNRGSRETDSNQVYFG
jgi:hypothetical protein